MTSSTVRIPTIQLDPRSNLPVYLQVASQLQRQIAAGKLRIGDRLPPVRLLAKRLGINFNTTARAYRLLVYEGALSGRPGRGTHVVSAARRTPRSRAVLAGLARRYIEQARQMDFSDAQIVEALTHLLPHPGDNHG